MSNQNNPEQRRCAVPTGSARFVEADGFIHVLTPLNSEFTLCGDAFDLGAIEGCEDYTHRPTKRRSVTCPNCARVVLLCKRVRVAAQNAAYEPTRQKTLNENQT